MTFFAPQAGIAVSITTTIHVNRFIGPTPPNSSRTNSTYLNVFLPVTDGLRSSGGNPLVQGINCSAVIGAWAGLLSSGAIARKDLAARFSRGLRAVPEPCFGRNPATSSALLAAKPVVSIPEVSLPGRCWGIAASGRPGEVAQTAVRSATLVTSRIAFAHSRIVYSSGFPRFTGMCSADRESRRIPSIRSST